VSDMSSCRNALSFLFPNGGIRFGAPMEANFLPTPSL
jgi:hypothetical protein